MNNADNETLKYAVCFDFYWMGRISLGRLAKNRTYLVGICTIMDAIRRKTIVALLLLVNMQLFFILFYRIEIIIKKNKFL